MATRRARKARRGLISGGGAWRKAPSVEGWWGKKGEREKGRGGRDSRARLLEGAGEAPRRATRRRRRPGRTAARTGAKQNSVGACSTAGGRKWSKSRRLDDGRGREEAGVKRARAQRAQTAAKGAAKTRAIDQAEEAGREERRDEGESAGDAQPGEAGPTTRRPRRVAPCRTRGATTIKCDRRSDSGARRARRPAGRWRTRRRAGRPLRLRCQSAQRSGDAP